MSEESIDLSKYWDLSEVINHQAYTDFEGLADPRPILSLLDDELVVDVLEGCADVTTPFEFLRDMLLHYAYENLDQAGHEVTPEEASTFISTMVYVFGSRYWMKVTDEQLETLRRAKRTQNG